MGEQMHRQRTTAEEVPETKPADPNGKADLTEIDELLDRIDEVLEENAEEFVVFVAKLIKISQFGRASCNKPVSKSAASDFGMDNHKNWLTTICWLREELWCDYLVRSNILSNGSGVLHYREIDNFFIFRDAIGNFFAPKLVEVLET